MGYFIILIIGLSKLLNAKYIPSQVLKWPQIYYTRGKLIVPNLNIAEEFEVWVDRIEQRRRFSFNGDSSSNIFQDGIMFSIFHVTTDTIWNEKMCAARKIHINDFHEILPNENSFKLSAQYDNNVTIWKLNDKYRKLNISKTLYTKINNNIHIPVKLEITGFTSLLGGLTKENFVFIYDEFEYFNCLSRKIFQKPLAELNCVSEYSFLYSDDFIMAKLKSLSHNIYDDLLNTTKYFQEYTEKISRNRAHDINSDQDGINFKNEKLFIEFYNRRNSSYFLRINPLLNVQLNTFTNKTINWRGNEIINVKNLSITGKFPILINWSDRINLPFIYIKKFFKAHNKEYEIPTNLDWRSRFKNIPLVKHQLSCGSCWAFGVTNAYEWGGLIYNNLYEDLSEQYLIDCSWGVNSGCYGGYMLPTYYWTAKNGGIPTSKTYGKNYLRTYKCRKNLTTLYKPFKAVSASIMFLNATVDELKIFISIFGPTPVLMNVNSFKFTQYGGGIYYDEDCSQSINDVNHLITLIGFDRDLHGNEFWIGQNSWSRMWGENGYVRISTKINVCGIQNAGAVPILEI